MSDVSNYRPPPIAVDLPERRVVRVSVRWRWNPFGDPPDWRLRLECGHVMRWAKGYPREAIPNVVECEQCPPVDVPDGSMLHGANREKP